MSHSTTAVAAATALLLAGPASAQLQKGTKAPVFAFARVWNDGPAGFDELAGRLVILDFSQTW